MRVGDFNTPFTAMDRSSKQKINKETRALNDTLDQMDLTDVFRAFHPKAAKYTFFFSAHGTFSRIYHILGHTSGLNPQGQEHNREVHSRCHSTQNCKSQPQQLDNRKKQKASKSARKKSNFYFCRQHDTLCRKPKDSTKILLKLIQEFGSCRI